MTVSDLLEQPGNKSDNAIKLVTACSKLVDNLGQAVRTQLVASLLLDLLQDVRLLRVYTGAIIFLFPHELIYFLFQQCYHNHRWNLKKMTIVMDT
jgi:hypothetical protein